MARFAMKNPAINNNDALASKSTTTLSWLIGILCLIVVSLLYIFLPASNSLETWTIDSFPTFIAAKLMLQGEFGAIYQHQVWTISSAAHPLWTEIQSDIGMQKFRTFYSYHPLYALLFVPLAALGTLKLFSALMLFTNLVSSAYVGAKVMQFSGQLTTKRIAIGVLISIFCLPNLTAIKLGQNIMPTLALMLLGLTLLPLKKSDSAYKFKSYCSIFIFILATILKPWAVLIFPLLFLAGFLKIAVIGFVLFLAITILMPAIIFPEIFNYYVNFMGLISDSTLVAHNNFSIRALIQRLENPLWGANINQWNSETRTTPGKITELFLLLIIALLYAVAVYVKKPSKNTIFMTGLSLMLIPLGICWNHYYVFTIPLCFYLLLNYSSKVPRYFGGLLLASLFYPFIAYPANIIGGYISTEAAYKMPVFFAVYFFLPTLIVLCSIFVALIYQPREPKFS